MDNMMRSCPAGYTPIFTLALCDEAYEYLFEQLNVTYEVSDSSDFAQACILDSGAMRFNKYSLSKPTEAVSWSPLCISVDSPKVNENIPYVDSMQPCPPMYAHIETESECRIAAELRGWNVPAFFMETVGFTPKGCYLVFPTFEPPTAYFNTHETGSPHPQSKSVCKLE